MIPFQLHDLIVIKNVMLYPLNFKSILLCDLQKNPKYPDFKHKDTGEALWVEGRYNPSWVKSQLAILDSRMESFRDQDARMHVNLMAGDDFMPF